MIQSPRKIIQGVTGTLLLTIFFVVCLDACVHAFGGSLSFAAVAIVFLAGNAIGSAAPTPGGLGAVEGALSLGLTLSGLTYEVATSAVLLFRLLTFWLPVLPGWASFTYLQRHEAFDGTPHGVPRGFFGIFRGLARGRGRWVRPGWTRPRC